MSDIQTLPYFNFRPLTPSVHARKQFLDTQRNLVQTSCNPGYATHILVIGIEEYIIIVYEFYFAILLV